MQIIKKNDGTITSPKGFKVAGLHSGVKRKRNDLGIIYSENPAQAAAVYTLNKVQAEPLKLTKKSLNKENIVQAVIVNSGNANACTGKQGMLDAIEMQKTTAEKFNLKQDHVAVASTGIIGLQMPMNKIIPHIKKLSLAATAESASDFGEAILTTDTFEKSVSFETEIDGKKVVMSGAAKGSGMIEPNMGTMFGFITTDANIEANVLDSALKEVVNQTFNCITVDGDTSTNDMVLVMANGQAENESLTKDHPEWEKFTELLKQTSEELSKMIAQDGEGASKLIEVSVQGAKSNSDAVKVAKSIVGSSLVKTAIFGTDPNWGRVIVAVGYSGVDIDPEAIDLSLGKIKLLENSEQVDFSEELTTKYLEKDIINININLNQGTHSGKAWGCDLTYDYVRINASYRS
ncbi:MAG TPA: bifunctional ornithine acetyltransferase/N-acetylglutamate synthase [Pseudogracilibacillus sp.]|nr:bifunctional ornithine acetyltransferase/N-acetylglutamate synthase [Pseudogracilibacillus sp.]